MYSSLIQYLAIKQITMQDETDQDEAYMYTDPGYDLTSPIQRRDSVFKISFSRSIFPTYDNTSRICGTTSFESSAVGLDAMDSRITGMPQGHCLLGTSGLPPSGFIPSIKSNDDPLLASDSDSDIARTVALYEALWSSCLSCLTHIHFWTSCRVAVAVTLVILILLCFLPRFYNTVMAQRTHEMASHSKEALVDWNRSREQEYYDPEGSFNSSFI